MEEVPDPLFTEAFLPLSEFQASYVQLHEPKKGYTHLQDRTLAALSYKTPQFRLPILNLLLPFLKVHTWDSTTGRLELTIEQESTPYKKLHALQESLIGLLQQNHSLLKYYNSTKEEVKHTFQPFLKDGILTIYLHGPNQDTKPFGRVWIWKENCWTQGAITTTFKRGHQIRVALRLQGVCFLQSPGLQTRLRVQHQTIAVIQKAAP
jgi:hypothetical protein